MTDNPEIQLLKDCAAVIAANDEGWLLREKLDHINFEVAEDVGNEMANASFRNDPDKGLTISVTRSLVEKGASWELYNALTHEMVHLTQQEDLALRRFFIINEDIHESVRINYLIECDAYVKAQSIMHDLESSKGIERVPSHGFSHIVADIYDQALEIGHDHSTGNAQTVLFQTLLASDEVAAGIIFPWLQSEVGVLNKHNRIVAEKQIGEGKINTNEIWTGETSQTNIGKTCLGKIKSENFMADDNGKLDYLEEDSFVIDKLPVNLRAQFNALCAAHQAEMRQLKPHLNQEPQTPHVVDKDGGEIGKK